MPEPSASTFRDILDDPIIVRVMACDGVKRDDLWKLMETVRARLLAQPARRIAA